MTAALEVVSGQQHAPAALYPRESNGTHFTGGCVGPRAVLDGRKISSPPGIDGNPITERNSDIQDAVGRSAFCFFVEGRRHRHKGTVY